MHAIFCYSINLYDGFKLNIHLRYFFNHILAAIGGFMIIPPTIDRFMIIFGELLATLLLLANIYCLLLDHLPSISVLIIDVQIYHQYILYQYVC